MIRRRAGNEFWLITQNDHAIVSGELAKHFGNERFAKPNPLEPTRTGIALHDCGWPIHDDNPTLNKDGFPLDVFETPPHLGFAIWTESARRATEQGPYCGLLVSLHGLNLSVIATAQMFDNEQFDPANRRVQFEINKFQYAQYELQDSLRKELGMRTDIPLHCGIAKESADVMEQKLVFNFQLLQAMDKLSLCMCCTKPPFAQVELALGGPGGKASACMVSRPEAQKLTMKPWPFDVDAIEVEIAYRAVPEGKFANEGEFREAYASSSVQRFGCSVVPG